MLRKNKQNLPLLACALAFALWGLNTPFIKISVESIPILSLLAIKYLFGAVVFTFFARKHWRRVSFNLSNKIVIATLSGYVTAGVLFYYGVELAGGLTASLIYLVAPLLLYFLSIEILKERYSARLLVGTVAGLLGAIMIVGAPFFYGSAYSQDIILGSALVILAVVADVAGTIIIKPTLKKLPVTQMTAARFIIAGVALSPFLVLQSDQLLVINWTPSLVVAVGYNLIFATLITFFLYHWSLRKMNVEKSSPLTYLDPMVGAVGSMIILGEQLTTFALAGVGLIVIGLYFGESRVKLPSRHFSHHR